LNGTIEQSELYIFHLTLTKTHPIKARGLLIIVKYFEDSGYKIDSKSMMMHLVFVLPQKANIREGLRNPVKPFTNYQAITKMEDNTTSVISKSEDERITKLFETQTQWLSYYIIINQ
jgi:GH35 family endo-1,4-beta-xylanase